MSVCGTVQEGAREREAVLERPRGRWPDAGTCVFCCGLCCALSLFPLQGRKAMHSQCLFDRSQTVCVRRYVGHACYLGPLDQLNSESRNLRQERPQTLI